MAGADLSGCDLSGCNLQGQVVGTHVRTSPNALVNQQFQIHTHPRVLCRVLCLPVYTLTVTLVIAGTNLRGTNTFRAKFHKISTAIHSSAFVDQGQASFRQ
jgi:uncharacterized protein YjbI with pentapeptide repeats